MDLSESLELVIEAAALGVEPLRVNVEHRGHVEIEPDVVVPGQVRIVGAETEVLEIQRFVAGSDEALAVHFAGARQIVDGDAAQLARHVQIAPQAAHLPRQVRYGRFGHFVLFLIEQHVEGSNLQTKQNKKTI